jgi:phospholipid transport system substrate-binding protein
MTSLKIIALSTFFLFVILNSSISEAIEQSPYLILENTAKSLFNKMANLSEKQRQDNEIMRAIVEEELLPILDYQYASFKILGSNIKNSTKSQRTVFVELMRENLLHTYTIALSAYENQQILFEPAAKFSNETIVTVRAKIVDTNAPTIHLNFKLRQNKRSKEWKVFDLAVEGISLLTTKRAEVSAQIRKVGLDGLIDILKKKNQSRQTVQPI